MGREIISMVPDADSRYLEARREGLKKAEHHIWGENEIREHERFWERADLVNDEMQRLEKERDEIEALLDSSEQGIDRSILETKKADIERDLSVYLREAYRFHRGMHLFFRVAFRRCPYSRSV